MNELTEQKPGEIQVAEEKEVTIMSMLAAAAADKDFDADKLEKLIGLKERTDAIEAKQAYIRAMADFHANPPVITKTKPVYGKDRSKGPQYYFADFTDVIKVVRPALLKVGITATWRSEPTGIGILKVTCILRHTLGHEESSSLAGGAETGGSKNLIQGIVSTDSYFRRNTLMAVTGLVAEGEDDDGLGGFKAQSIGDEQLSHIQELLIQSETDISEFCSKLHLGSVSDLSNAQYGAAVNILNARIKRKAQ